MNEKKPVTTMASVVLVGLLFTLAAAMVYFPMCFGLMQDAQNLQLVRTDWTHLTFLEILRDYSFMDAGTFKPIYTLFVYLFYGGLQAHPKIFYLLNYGWVVLAMVPWALLLSRQVTDQYRREWTLIFCFLLLVATPLYNLTTHLVLLEKFVILFGGWAYYEFDRSLGEPDKSSFYWWARQALVFVWVLFGFWSKPTFIAYMPWLILAMALSQRLSRFYKSGALGLFLLTTLFMGYSRLSNKSSYNTKYRTDIAGLLERIHALPPSYYVFFGLACLTLAVLVYLRWKDRLPHPAWLSQLMWPISLLSFLAVMLPWGINTYYWAPLMVSACGCLVLLADHCPKPPRFQSAGVTGALLISMLLAVAGVCRVGIPRLSRQAEIGTIAQWLSARFPNKDVAVYVEEPCQEATNNLQYYAGGRQPFDYLKQTQVPASPRPTWWLITRDECNIAPQHSALFNRVIYELPHWKVYEYGRPVAPPQVK